MDHNTDKKDQNQPPKYDPISETKLKLLFFVVAIVVLVVLKYWMGV